MVFKPTGFFQIRSYFSYPELFFKQINRFQTYSQKKFQTEKSFSNLQKNKETTNLFQMHKIIRVRQIFFKSTKKVQIGNSLLNP